MNTVAFSPDGKLALSGSDDRTLKLWDVATGREVRRFEGTGGVHSVALSPDGALAASGSNDGTVKIWDVAKGTDPGTLPDGKHVLSGSWDRTLKLWDAATGAQVRTLPGHGVTCVATDLLDDPAAPVAGDPQVGRSLHPGSSWRSRARNPIVVGPAGEPVAGANVSVPVREREGQADQNGKPEPTLARNGA